MDKEIAETASEIMETRGVCVYKRWWSLIDDYCAKHDQSYSDAIRHLSLCGLVVDAGGAVTGAHSSDGSEHESSKLGVAGSSPAERAL